jgi:hypothetical protein
MSRFHGPQKKGAMTEYRTLKREEALERQRAERLLQEQRSKSTKHLWEPSPTSFACVCINEKCEAVWLPQHVHAPKTNCPYRKTVEKRDRRSERAS